MRWGSRSGYALKTTRIQECVKGSHGAAPSHEESSMTWETPAYCEIRLGFEVTAYVYVR